MAEEKVTINVDILGKNDNSKTVNINIQKSKTLGQLNKEIHKKLGLATYDQLSLKYQDSEIDINDPEISKLTIESVFTEEDGYTVECKLKESGFFDKTLTLRNATDSELEIWIVYEVKEFSKERNISVGVTPKVGINMTEGAAIGLGMKLNIEGRHFKPNEKVKSYEVQTHVKSFKIPFEKDFSQGIVELYVKRSDSEEKYAHFTVRPKVYIIHNSQKGALLCDETKMFRTWITDSGINCKPQK